MAPLHEQQSQAALRLVHLKQPNFEMAALAT
jgi:hypothetical protein